MKKIASLLIAVTMVTSLFAFAAPAMAAGPDLVVNGNFEAGNTGFSTEYNYLDPSNTGSWTLGPEYMYTIGTDPFLYHSAWASFGDHTSGSGKMMIVNGTYENQETKIIWSEDVSLSATDPNVTEYLLYAGQNWLVGQVLVKNTDDKVCVKLVLNQETVDAHYLMTEVHIAIGDSLSDIPQSKGNPVPGHFPVSLRLNPGQTEYEYCFDNEWAAGTPLFIAAHAVVSRPDIFSTVDHEFCVTSGAETDLASGEDAAIAWGPGDPWGSVDDNVNNIPDCLDFANYIWDAQWVTPAVADEGGMVDFTQAFNIVGTPTGATLKIAADNAFAYTLNSGAEIDENLATGWRDQALLGNFDYPGVVIDPNPSGWSQVCTYDVLGSLVPGENILDVTAVNADWNTTSPLVNPAMVTYKLCGTSVETVKDHCARTETAWGGTADFPGKNWANHIEYTTQAEPFYRFTMWARSSHPTEPAILQVKVADDVIGTASLTSDTSQWFKYEYDFKVDSAASAAVVLRNFRLIAHGDDFAIDDIPLVKLP